MGRTSDAKERLIETARELMHDKGYEAVGVGEICAKARVNKGSFYHFFESKQRLGIAALDAYWAETKVHWQSILEKGSGSPFGSIEALMKSSFQQNRDAQKVCGHVSGCMLGNLALEQSNQSPEVQTRLREIFQEQANMLAETLAPAQADGLLAEGVTAKSAARSILAYIEGMVMMAKVHNDPKLLRGMSKDVLRMIAA